MSDQRRFLALDLGAESGRAVVGTLEGGRLSLEELHRFANEPVEVGGTLHWDVLGLYGNVLKGMLAYSQRFGGSVDGIGIDTWGVDFGLLAADGTLLQNPVHYRDSRTDGIADAVAERMPHERVYELAGMPLYPIQTLCQLLAMRRAASPILDAASTFLMMPDLLGYFLTGEKRGERTDAITTELYDPRAGRWCDEIFERLDLPREIMPTLVDPGTVLGGLRDSVGRQTGLEQGVVIDSCTHDTASAVAAVPAEGDDWAFVSSGTWSVVGALTDRVVTTPEALAAGFCNELTVGSFFLCRNIMGLWLLQQARAAWERGGQAYSYPDLVALAGQSPAGGPLIDPDDGAFLAPEDMSRAIAEYCERTDQPQPRGPAASARCILESLALSYRHALEQLGSILGRRFRAVHVVGGGSLNTLLCQLTADATALPVVAGPVETTAAGNVLVQALARGHLASPAEVRRVVRRSTDLARYEPKDTAAWQERYGAFRRMLERARN